MSRKSNKTNLIISIILILVGCVLACSNIISNDYIKLVAVIASLAYGLFGLMKSLGSADEEETNECA